MSTIARPFGMLLLWLYEFTKSYGWSIILFAFIVKVILTPFMAKSKYSMMRMTALTPKLQEIQKKHGANRQKYSEEVTKLYQSEGINPSSGCIWSLIPFPILIALYEAIRYPLTVMMGISKSALAEGGAIYELLYNPTQEMLAKGYEAFSSSVSTAYVQIAQTEHISKFWSFFEGVSDKLRQIDFSFLGIDLGAVPNWQLLWKADYSNAEEFLPQLGLFMIPIIAALLTYLTSYISNKMNPPMEGQSQGAAAYIMMPLMTLVFAFMMPAALGLYWIASSVFGIIQDVLLTKKYKKRIDAENAERRAREAEREAELEAKRKETERLKAENATTVNENTSKRKQQAKQKQQQAEKAAEWERMKVGKTEDDEPSRVGQRKYARGRAYDPDRYNRVDEETPEETEEAPEEETLAVEEPEKDTESFENEEYNENTDYEEENNPEDE